MMKITITEQEGRMVATLAGKLDTVASNQAERDLAPLFERNDCDVLFDCQELSYISSSGLRLLLNVYRHVNSFGHTTFLAGLHSGSELYEALELAGFFQLFKRV